MITTISHKTCKARIDHEDSAGVWIREQLSDIRINIKMTFSEWRAILKLKNQKWKILKGQHYERFICKQDGEIYTFKCLKEINQICLKYELYCE